MRFASTWPLLGALCLTACFDPGEGRGPPTDRFYFPVGIALSPGGQRLYVANSDFDLQFNAGTVQALDVGRVRELVPRPCRDDSGCAAGDVCDNVTTAERPASFLCAPEPGVEPCGVRGVTAPSPRLLIPGRCGPIDPARPFDGGPPALIGAVQTGAFATDVVYRRRPNGPGGRLFIPIRGDSTLTWIDVDDELEDSVGFVLECGQNANDGRCDDLHRAGDDPEVEQTRGLRMPSEPFGIGVQADGEALVVSHQNSGVASLFVNDWGDGQTTFGLGPQLEFVLGGLPSGGVGLVAIPEPAIVAAQNIDYQPGFLMSFRDIPEVRLLRFFDDERASPQRPFIQQAGAVGIATNTLGFDSRGIAIDPRERLACEAACAPGDEDCLSSCAGIALDVFVGNRTPSSLVVGRTRPNNSPTSSDDLPIFSDTAALSFGVSRVVVGDVIGLDGLPARRVFVLAFDSRLLYIFDPDRGEVERTVRTGRGPSALAVETAPPMATGEPHFGYLAHFTDSYVGVLDLDQRNVSYGEIIGTVGVPEAPRSSQ